MPFKSYIKHKLIPLLKIPGSKAYLVGGALRDLILGAQPEDFDLIVSGDPGLYARMLADRIKGRCCILGRPPKAVHRIHAPGMVVDIDGIKNGDVFYDLNKRDFRMNAMACDLDSIQMIDPFNGCQDISLRTIRMVSEESFKNDPVRVLRAYRFAAGMGFSIAPNTIQAMQTYAENLSKVAGERIWTELQFILSADQSADQILAMDRQNVLKEILPELADLKGCNQNQYHAMDAYDHSVAAYQAMEAILTRPDTQLPKVAVPYLKTMDAKTRILIKLAVLLHDIGKLETFSRVVSKEIHFYKHASVGAREFHTIAARLKISNAQCDWIETIIRNHQRPLMLFLAHENKQSFKTLAVGRFLRKTAGITPDLLLHALADSYAKTKEGLAKDSAFSAYIKDLLAYYFSIHDELIDKAKLVNGYDLIHHFGLTPSRLIGNLLDQIEEERLAGLIKSRQEALQRASQLIQSKAGSCT